MWSTQQSDAILAARDDPKVLEACIDLTHSGVIERNASKHMLRHHVATTTSFSMQLWGPAGTCKRTQVSLWLRQLASPTSSLQQRPLVVEVDNVRMPRHVSSRKYTQIVADLFSHSATAHREEEEVEAERRAAAMNMNNADVDDDDTSSSDDEASSSSSSSSAGAPATASTHTQSTSAATAHHSHVPRSGVMARHLSAELRRLSDRKQSVIFVLYRMELCVRASKKVLYAVLNHIADSASSVVFIATMRPVQVLLEKRITSRYNPFMVHMSSTPSAPVLAGVLSKLCPTVPISVLTGAAPWLQRMSDCGLGLSVLRQITAQWVLAGQPTSESLASVCRVVLDPSACCGPTLPPEAVLALAGCVVCTLEEAERRDHASTATTFTYDTLTRQLGSRDGAFPHRVGTSGGVWRYAVLCLLESGLVRSLSRRGIGTQLGLAMPVEETLQFIATWCIDAADKTCFERYMSHKLQKRKRREI
eukprot:PhM_4_TR9522/c1_g1_i1/m.70823